ncbi:hypothetical protein DICSQDRAFT_178276 [Dichomitus squalens LYAD-421 SS1]|uniref:uncharacterized protein n=1 Tax=Dichomitus squalens (strain LYAD-421) TaxID=732165 RepID=UPI0004414FA9|nr:uncharacterized protein DICSQDRAFT_178276 [Dichomitus squalens LYAD-421 SS1]EJF64649.1 hypothetical protein DICSQDRAFT_178276 [Dichomitus squalens LYAD-421 SS1]
MDRLHDHYQSYSWHQSHDQATVLVLLPYDTVEEEVSVIIEENHLVAGVRGQPPVVKGQLYGKVDTAASVWQLEPRPSRLSPRERTTSTASTTSTQSSYAVISDPEFSSSFAASLEAGLISGSDLDDTVISSPALSSPISSSADERLGIPPEPRPVRRSPLAASPLVRLPQDIPHASSFSSLESLHTGSGRLLTLHLEKADSVIWPSLIIGPVPESISPPPTGVYPWLLDITSEMPYNMDPTSLVLVALDLYDIRKAKEDAFEYFIRAWHQARLPSAAIRLTAHYLPLTTIVPDELAEHATGTGTTLPTPSTPTPSGVPSAGQLTTASTPAPSVPTPPRGSTEYYISRLGGASGLAQLFLAAGLLHLEGTAASLLASSYAGLSSLRSPFAMSGPPPGTGTSTDGAEAWRRDREQAARFFVRARVLSPALDVPLLPAEETESEDNESGSGADSGTELAIRPREPRDRSQQQQRPPQQNQRTVRRKGQRVQGQQQLEMPTLDVAREAASAHDPLPPPMRRRRRKEPAYASDDADEELSSSMVESVHKEPPVELGGAEGNAEDRTWYLYLPGLVGAGTALLVVGLLSLQSWRRNQG